MDGVRIIFGNCEIGFAVRKIVVSRGFRQHHEFFAVVIFEKELEATFLRTMLGMIMSNFEGISVLVARVWPEEI
jgi:hypothetical protein